jgi:hypothetical protein
MCTVLLPPGDNPIAVNKYIIIRGGKRECCFRNSGTRGEKMLKSAVLEGITVSTADQQRTNWKVLLLTI